MLGQLTYAFLLYQRILKVSPLFKHKVGVAREFNVQRQGRIPSRNTIVSWFNMFKATGNLLPFHGSGHYVHTPENIQTVRLAVQRSSLRSAVRHAAA